MISFFWVAPCAEGLTLPGIAPSFTFSGFSNGELRSQKKPVERRRTEPTIKESYPSDNAVVVPVYVRGDFDKRSDTELVRSGSGVRRVADVGRRSRWPQRRSVVQFIRPFAAYDIWKYMLLKNWIYIFEAKSSCMHPCNKLVTSNISKYARTGKH